MNIGGIGAKCTGCGCCEAVCPASCIEMRPDGQGFRAPAVDEARCTDCGLCLRRCPANAPKAERPDAPETYAARSRDEATLAESSSGGLFTALARECIARGGTVYGAVLDEADWTAEIRGARSMEEVAPMRGSKYVQSALRKETLRGLRAELEAGREVLFSGCPCQVAAARAYLQRDYERFTAVDIVCHGVPSPLLFQEYVRALSEKRGAPVSRYRFRDKRKGWGMRVSYVCGGIERFVRSAVDPYQNHFLKGNVYRESCYRCPFASPARQGDLTIGDYWGILREHPGFYDERGVSLMLVNTEKGRTLWEKAREGVLWIPSEFERAAAHNRNLRLPSVRPAAREGIYEGLGRLSPSEYVRLRLRVKNSPKELIAALTPVALKRLMSRKGRSAR